MMVNRFFTHTFSYLTIRDGHIIIFQSKKKIMNELKLLITYDNIWMIHPLSRGDLEIS